MTLALLTIAGMALLSAIIVFAVIKVVDKEGPVVYKGFLDDE